MNPAFIDARLNALVPETDLLSQAMRYALLGPGKRIRPLLLLAAAGTPVALDAACAVEMIHAYSLIHDDLPCMDDDDFRRGRPSLHRVYPEALALLAGDALLTRAFALLAETPHPAPVKARLFGTLAARAYGMVEGQAVDILAETRAEAPLLDMYAKKTGDLLSACLEMGALIAENGQEAHMREMGLHLGLAYQIRDDLQDEDGALPKARAQELLQISLDQLESGLQGHPALLDLLDPLFSLSRK